MKTRHEIFSFSFPFCLWFSWFSFSLASPIVTATTIKIIFGRMLLFYSSFSNTHYFYFYISKPIPHLLPNTFILHFVFPGAVHLQKLINFKMQNYCLGRRVLVGGAVFFGSSLFTNLLTDNYFHFWIFNFYFVTAAIIISFRGGPKLMPPPSINFASSIFNRWQN